MSPFSPQPITPQKRSIEKALEQADSILRTGGLNKKSFYGGCKKTKVFSKLSKFGEESWNREDNRKDVYDFDENGATPIESPFTRAVKPYEIGFPNPFGTNICWMNASLQIILGMRPLVDELESPFGGSISRNHYSPILRTFLDLMRQYKKGRMVPVHKDLGNLRNALASLDTGFVGEHQQDAPEFLIRLLDNFRENFYEMGKLEKKSQESGALKELKFENNNTPISSSTPSENRQTVNPVCDNLQFSMREHYCCTSCGGRSDHSQEHLALYIDIPMQHDEFVSVHSALEQYMTTHTRDLHCDKCGGEQSRVDTVFNQLPRILLIQAKRYTCLDHLTQKITSSIKIPTELNVRRVVDTDVVMPKPWNVPKEEKENCSSSFNGNCSGKGIDSCEDDTDEEEDISKFSYTLTGILSHHGDNPYAGHYVADVYHHAPRSWFHYDDETVERVKEADVLGSSREESGYMFVYTYRPLYEQLHKHQQLSPSSVRSYSRTKLF